MAFNIVEAIQGEDADYAFDQPCKFGHRVGGHAVYCHNDSWSDSPRKCRRSWYTGGEVKDEDCPGFQPNTAFSGSLNQTPLLGELCKKCGGTKLIQVDRMNQTCPRCMGCGAEPKATEMSQYEQDTLELGLTHSGKHSCNYDRYVRIAETKEQADAVCRLEALNLVEIKSISRTGNATVFLISLTGKGDATVRANWEARKRND